MCDECRIKRKEFCINYHVTRNNAIWYKCFIQLNFVKKFSNNPLLMQEMRYYSSFDFELVLREVYEARYIREPDTNHEYW